MQSNGVWGDRLTTFKWMGGIVTLLFLKKDTRCSWHIHSTTINRFTCISGKVGIKTDKGHTTILTPKQVFEVEPGIKHEFQVYEDSVVEEIAYVKYDANDIIREALGSVM